MQVSEGIPVHHKCPSVGIYYMPVSSVQLVGMFQRRIFCQYGDSGQIKRE
jgi:hypothetical protein